MFLGVVGVSMYAIPQQSRPTWYYGIARVNQSTVIYPMNVGELRMNIKKNFNNNLPFIPD